MSCFTITFLSQTHQRKHYRKNDEINEWESSPKTSGKFFWQSRPSSLLNLHPFHSKFALKYRKNSARKAAERLWGRTALSRQDDSSKTFANQPLCSTANDIKHKKSRNFNGFSPKEQELIHQRRQKYQRAAALCADAPLVALVSHITSRYHSGFATHSRHPFLWIYINYLRICLVIQAENPSQNQRDVSFM